MTTVGDTERTPGGAPTPIGAPPASGRRPRGYRPAHRARVRPPGRGARAVAAVGRGLITAGLLVLGFVAFQLWGTNLLNAREQRELRGELAEQLDAAGVDVPTGVPTEAELAAVAVAVTRATDPPPADPAPDPPPGAVTTTTLAPSALVATDGEALAALVIPKLGVEQYVVEGVGRGELRKGPGHYPSTPLPGQHGNASIAGHRTTHGAPFNRLDELVAGDPIVVTTVDGIFTYRVVETTVVDPSDVSVLDPVEGEDTLTLTTCHPEYSARERLVVRARFVAEESSPLVGAVGTGAEGAAEAGTAPDELAGDDEPSTSTTTAANGTTPSPATSTTAVAPTGDAPTAGPGDAAGDVDHLEGWGAPGAAFLLWAVVVAAVGGAWWWAFRRRRRVTTWLAGVVPFLVVLFLLYVQVELVLPAGY